MKLAKNSYFKLLYFCISDACQLLTLHTSNLFHMKLNPKVASLLHVLP